MAIKRETTAFLTAFLVGATAGGVAALLLAPSSGAETRKKVKDTWDQARRKTRDELDRVKEFTQTRTSALRAAVREGKEAYQQTLEAGHLAEG